jgi:hypothetical protein
VRFNLSNIRFPFSRAPRIATLYPGDSPFAGRQHLAPPAAPNISDAEQRRVERAQEFEHFLRAMSSGEAEQRYGHLRQQPVGATATTRPAPARSSAPIAGRAGFLPTPNQQAAYDEQLHRDAGSPLPPEQSAAAAHLILRSAARAEGKNQDLVTSAMTMMKMRMITTIKKKQSVVKSERQRRTRIATTRATTTLRLQPGLASGHAFSTSSIRRLDCKTQ